MSNLFYCCDSLKYALEDESIPVQYVSKFREYGIRVLDGGSSYLSIEFCPWCGAKLPTSLRDKWFDAIESRGIDPADVDAIPAEFLDDRWFMK